jgi:hypothetical protein
VQQQDPHPQGRLRLLHRLRLRRRLRLIPRARARGNLLQENERVQTYARPEGVEHNIVNPGDEEFRFIEIELKAAK